VLFPVAYLLRYWWTGLSLWPGVSAGWHAVLAILGAYPVFALASHAWKYRRRRHLIYCVFSLCAIGAGLHDIALVGGTNLQASPFYVLQTVAPVWFIIICFVLITDFTKSLRAQREQQIQLVVQLETQKQELNRLHANERHAQELQAAAQERSRIMQDIHDGLGSQLVSSLAMAQGGQLTPEQTYDLLRSCIDDLRLAIDSSTDSQDSLSFALGNLRFRMEPRLKAAGIDLQWNTLSLDENIPLPVDLQLPILRIIQETITNTLKHAQAKLLRVTVSSLEHCLTIDISDDGHGFDIERARSEARGKGLNSIAKRCRTLGAELSVTSSEGGTRTLLALKLSDRV
jgi:signal transduction histidine kinase